MVRVETALLRSTPDTDHKPKGLLDAGRKARVVERKEGWAKVKLESGTEGWVRSDLLSVSRKVSRDHSEASADRDTSSAPRKRLTAAAKKTAKKAVVIAAKKRDHKAAAEIKKTAAVKQPAPARHKTVVAAATTPKPKVPAAKIVAVNASSNNTSSVRNTRFLRGMDLRSSTAAVAAAASIRRAAAQSRSEATRLARPEPSAKREQVANLDDRPSGLIRSALSFRGTPYRMGSRGQGAFDCSGFTQFVFAKSGKSLPRTAAEQAGCGQGVDRDSMKSGDLVFFKNTYKPGVSHVGIYIGNGQFVHASSRGGVRTNSLSESYYVNHWAGARRIL